MERRVMKECYGQPVPPKPNPFEGPCFICGKETTCITAIRVGYNGKCVIVCCPEHCEQFIQNEDKERIEK